ncbi:hypothetical protein ACFORJ_01595 [Corynebacterium hansenii]|uniref:Uncharacterized protein n=1 Tax=Corynebacterium hansenii TaxID=394964 RepID=A0ABV7ZJY8_9CORY|nr:hypothetical protein [Corynebacterium hansenii]WJY99307.1 hypothetical protein CHAN_03395 [Corynebacterium hansenii]
MLTLRDLITDALYETSSCPVVDELTVHTTTESTILVDIEIPGAPHMTRYADGSGGFSLMEDWTDTTESTDHIDWDPTTDPTVALSDITSGAIPDGADEADAHMDITMPVEMLARIVDTYLDGRPEVVLPWEPDPTMYGTNRDFTVFNSEVATLAKRRTDGGWLEGLWAGTDLAAAMRTAVTLDDQLEHLGLEAAFTELCVPRRITGDDIRAGLVAHIDALRTRAEAVRHHRPGTAAA